MEPSPPNQPISKEMLKTKLNFVFNFGPHGTIEDAKALRPQLSSCDVFVPEMGGWTQKTKQTYNDVALGKEEPFAAVERIGSNYPHYQLSVFEELRGTNKAVAFADIPSGHSLLAEEELLEKTEVIVNDEFLPAMKKRLEIARARGKFIAKREAYITEHLPEVVAEAIRDNPELVTKNKINVLVQLGSTHTNVAHSLEKEGYVIELQTFPTKQYSFGGFGHELSRRVIFNKPISEDLLARTMIEDLFLTYYGKNYNFLVEQPLDVLVLSRSVISNMSLADLQSCWDDMRGITVGFQYAFERILAAKGITLPKNSEEIKKLISKQGVKKQGD